MDKKAFIDGLEGRLKLASYIGFKPGGDEMRLQYMCGLRILFLLAFLVLLGQQLVQTQRAAAASTYYVASLDGTIEPGAQDFVVSAINDAQSVGANHFILILNTLGGAGDNMINIISAISKYESTPGNVFITLIGPSSSHAFSAGSFIAEASTQIVMVNATQIGSATPIITGIPGEEIASVQQKDIAAFTTYMQSLTAQFDRNTTATGLMVTNGKSYNEQEAYDFHVIDQWVKVSTISDALTALGASGQEIHTPGLRSQAITILSDPNVDALLFLIGSFAILIDLTHPTLIVSAIGGAALVLALFGFGLFGASLTSIFLMLIGALFIFLELKTHHGVSALVGVVIFVIGFLLIFRTPPLPAQPSTSTPPVANFFQISTVTYVIIGAIAVAGIALSLYLYGLREQFQKRTPFLDPKGIIGKEGILLGDLKAGGVATANVGAEEWSVTASADIAKGARVRVKGVQGLKVTVEKVEGK